MSSMVVGGKDASGPEWPSSFLFAFRIQPCPKRAPVCCFPPLELWLPLRLVLGPSFLIPRRLALDGVSVLRRMTPPCLSFACTVRHLYMSSAYENSLYICGTAIIPADQHCWRVLERLAGQGTREP